MDLVVQICSIIASVSAAVGVVWKLMKKAIVNGAKESIKDSVEASASQQSLQIQAIETALNQKMDNLDTKIDAFIETQSTSNDTTKQALLASTRDRINEAHALYMQKNYIGAHSLFVIEELYKSYKILGGNSFVDRQMEDIRRLRIVNAEEVHQDI